MKEFQTLKIFALAMRKKSLSEAARALGLSPATISRRISALEAELGVQLLDRTSRTLKATEAGSKFLRHAQRAIEAIDEAKAVAKEATDMPEGRLRIHSRTQTGLRLIAPLLPKFVERYPGLQIEHELSEHPVNLVEHGFDIDIRTGVSDDSNFIIKRLASSDEILVASPAFAQAHAHIQHPSDLMNVRCLTYQRDSGVVPWHYFDEMGVSRELPVKGVISSNSGEVLRVAAIGGAGVALLFGATVRSSIVDGSLVRLLPEYRFVVTSIANGIYAVFRRSDALPMKVRAFIDFISEELRATEGM
ncbi:LysR family transcriptional regulator [Ottowia thiooxydans]|uniref:LysR family transcriptional regulator n=1 Tax=Ottowia thiooxydans TaxID=219182 RepID=UPI000424DF80|nr:LysR family transcriptional regulator [Ottowia thiooxydans]